MRRRSSSSDSPSRKSSLTANEGVQNIRSKPNHIFDNITRKLLKLGITLAITTFIGLIVRYLVQEFDPNVGQIVSVSTSRVGNRDFASFSVSRNFLQRILEFIEESLSIIATVIPLGFPLCTVINKYFARTRAGHDRIRIDDERVFCMIPKYVVIGDSLACQTPNGSSRLRPLVRDSIYHLIKAHLKPKLICEDSHQEARKLGMRIGLLRRDHHRLACIKSVDLLKNITDSRGDIKQAKVRYLLSRLKILTQSTPADKSFLIYLIKHCETQPNDKLVYLGYSFTDPEAMRLADCAMTYADCDDDDVKRCAQVQFKSPNQTFTDLYLFVIVTLLYSNIVQSYALYQISASVSSCLYRFLTITVFQEQLISHSQFMLLSLINQLFAIFALMTKWLSSLPKSPLRPNSVAEMSHAVIEDSILRQSSSAAANGASHRKSRSSNSLATTGNGHDRWQTYSSDELDDDLDEEENLDVEDEEGEEEDQQTEVDEDDDEPEADVDLDIGSGSGSKRAHQLELGGLVNTPNSDQHHSSKQVANGSESVTLAINDHRNQAARKQESSKSPRRAGNRSKDKMNNNKTSRSSSRSRSVSRSRNDRSMPASATPTRRQASSKKPRRTNRRAPIHLSGVDLDDAIIDSKLVTSYKQTFHNSKLIDDVTYRLVKLQIAYQILVLIIIMVFGHSMFQLNQSNSRQHQTLALNSLIMNNIFNLANCFNQFGAFNLRSGLKNHPFFLCLLILAIFVQVCLTELNAFGLENLNPIQWFVCFVFASLSALIAPLTGQQQQQLQQQMLNNKTISTGVTPETRLNNSSTNYKREKHSKKHNK